MDREIFEKIYAELDIIRIMIYKELERQRSWRLLKFALYLLAFVIIYLLIDTRLS